MARRALAAALALALLAPCPEAVAAAHKGLPVNLGAPVSLGASVVPVLPGGLAAPTVPIAAAGAPAMPGTVPLTRSVVGLATGPGIDGVPGTRTASPVTRASAPTGLTEARTLVGEISRAPEAGAALDSRFDGSTARPAGSEAVRAAAAPSRAPVLERALPIARRRSGLAARGYAVALGLASGLYTAAARAQEDPRLFMPLDDRIVPGAPQASTGGGIAPMLIFMAVTAALIVGGVLLSRYQKRRTERHWAKMEADTSASEIVQGPDASGGKKKPKVTFDDVAGQDEAKRELQSVVNFLKNPDKYRKLGGEDYKRHKGVLLFGPPGTGKTLLARAVADQAGASFFKKNGSDFVEQYVGVGSQRVRALFENARKVKGPVIIFIDEIDALARQRKPGGNDEYEQTVNALLAEMDGFDKDNIVVIAATNRPDSLDAGILRGRRFGMKVPVGLPDRAGREAILKVLTKNARLAPDVDLGAAAAQTGRLAGADLAEIVSDAVGLAGDRDAEAVAQADLMKAVDRFTGGHERRRAMAEDERRTVAVHESGHTLLSRRLPNSDPVRKITIVPHGLQALGFMQTYEEVERNLPTREWMLDRLATLMGGRAAEELVLGKISAGASDDFEQAKRLARMMVMKLGMSEKVGPVSYDLDDEAPKVGKPMSEGLRRLIDAEIEKLLRDAMAKAKEVISGDREAHARLVAALLEKETLGPEDLELLLPLTPPAGLDGTPEAP